MTIETQVAAPVAAAAPAAAPVAAPAVAAPVAAPAAVATALPAVPAPAAEVPAGAFGASVSYEPTGHAAMDLAMGYLGGLGLSLDNPAMKSAETGDFGPLKGLLAGKGVQGWEQYVAIAEDYQKGYAEKQAEATKVTQDICVAAAGSPEVWQDVLAWAGAEAEPAEREAINSALGGGGLVAEAMAHFLVNGYRQAPGTTVEGKQAVNPQAAAVAAPPAVGPLDPKAYGAAVLQLHAKLGNRMDGSAELAALDRRRAMYRG